MFGIVRTLVAVGALGVYAAPLTAQSATKTEDPGKSAAKEPAVKPAETKPAPDVKAEGKTYKVIIDGMT